jgi:hypothetical protein
MAGKYIRICSAFIAIKEMQIKMTPRSHLSTVRMAVVKKTVQGPEGN